MRSFYNDDHNTLSEESYWQSMLAERKTERSGRKTAWAGAERWAGVEKNHLSGSGAERAKSAAQIRSHQHCIGLAISAACILLFY